MKVKNVYGGFTARGKLGNTIIGQTHYNRQIIRQTFKPHNTKSQRQEEQRLIFSEAVKEYAGLTPAEKLPWQTEAKEKHTTPTGLYFKNYARNWAGLAYLGVGRLGIARLNREGI